MVCSFFGFLARFCPCIVKQLGSQIVDGYSQCMNHNLASCYEDFFEIFSSVDVLSPRLKMC